LKEIREQIKPCVRDVAFLLNNLCQESNKFIIIEGANAAMLDIDFGTYPYVTSSNCTIGGVCSGLGVQPRYIGECIAITKAYTTRVGLGAFATELLNVIYIYFFWSNLVEFHF
jgi:adenylosuccinate synthase